MDNARTALLQNAYTLELLPADRRKPYAENVPMVTVGEIATDIAYGSSAKSAKSGEGPGAPDGGTSKAVNWTGTTSPSRPIRLKSSAMRCMSETFYSIEPTVRNWLARLLCTAGNGLLSLLAI
jgi:hypothetical protein